MPLPPRPAAAFFFAAALSLTATSTWVARAQGSASQAALADGRDALAAYEAGRYQEALATFQKAEQQYHTPVFLLYIARCHRELGQLVVARDTFDQVMSEELGETAPEPWIRAREDAKTEHEALSALIPELIVTVAEATDGVTLTIDDNAAPLDAPVALDPGQHVVRAVAGARSVEQTVTLEVGVDRRVTLELAEVPEPHPVAPPGPKPAAAIPLPPPSEPDTGTSGLAVAGYVLSGLGLVGVATGIITGVMALDANEDAGENCDPLCPHENLEHEERALTLAHASTGSFVVGGAALGLGILFIILSPRGDDVAARRIPLHVDARGVGIRF